MNTRLMVRTCVCTSDHSWVWSCRHEWCLLCGHDSRIRSHFLFKRPQALRWLCVMPVVQKTQLKGWRRRWQNQSLGPPHRGRAAGPSAAAGALAHRRSALRGEVRPRTSPAAGRHLVGARDVKKTKNHYSRGVLCYKARYHSSFYLQYQTYLASVNWNSQQLSPIRLSSALGSQSPFHVLIPLLPSLLSIPLLFPSFPSPLSFPFLYSFPFTPFPLLFSLSSNDLNIWKN